MGRESASAPLPSRDSYSPDWMYVSETILRNHADLAAWFSPFTGPQRILETWTTALTAQADFLEAVLAVGERRVSKPRD